MDDLDGHLVASPRRLALTASRPKRSILTMKLPLLDGEPFIKMLEQGIEDGRADYIEANMPRLREIILLYQERIAELSQLQYRA